MENGRLFAVLKKMVSYLHFISIWDRSEQNILQYLSWNCLILILHCWLCSISLTGTYRRRFIFELTSNLPHDFKSLLIFLGQMFRQYPFIRSTISYLYSRDQPYFIHGVEPKLLLSYYICTEEVSLTQFIFSTDI